MNTEREVFSRRKFIRVAGQMAAAGSLLGGVTASAAETASSDRKIKIGIVGGGFGAAFQWQLHPNCIVHAVSDLRPDRRDILMQTYGCKRSYESLEKLILDKELDAVAVFSGAPDHVRHVTMAMNAGKHVICAVPAAMSLEECEKLREVKEKTGLKYMMAETSYYRYYTIAARQLFQEGKFGELFYSEVEYYHPYHPELGNDLLFYKGQRTWRYGLPPMHYPTHSTGFLVGVTKERFTEVSCLGWTDSTIPMLAEKDNVYKNPFGVGSALMKTDKNHMCRCNVFWAGTSDGERAQWFGTKLSYYMPGSGGQPFKLLGKDVPDWKDVPNFWERLPAPLRIETGHGGSHPFITHEFISALLENREPTVNVYEAIAMTAPGIVAHQSALKGGEQLKIPNFDRKA
jgi:predicted dehydrogenase